MNIVTTEKGQTLGKDWVSPPGDTILDLIEERDCDPIELAQRLGFSDKQFNQLIKGKISLTNDTALLLENVLGSTANFWLNREMKYRYRLRRQDAQQGGNPIRGENP